MRRKALEAGNVVIYIYRLAKSDKKVGEQLRSVKTLPPGFGKTFCVLASYQRIILSGPLYNRIRSVINILTMLIFS